MSENRNTDLIYQALEEELLTLTLKPGDTVTENQLCTRFHVSRTPIRSVLQRLEQNGFLSIIPHRETVVTPIDLNIVKQLIFARIAIESSVIRDFIKIATPVDLAKVRYYLSLQENYAAKMSEDPEHFDLRYFLDIDLKMHRIWFQATDREYLWERLTDPQPDYSRFIRLDMIGAANVPDVLSEHKKLIEILEAGRTDEIEALLTKHLFGGIRRIGGRLFSEEYRSLFRQQGGEDEEPIETKH